MLEVQAIGELVAHQRALRLWIITVTISVFGPYVVGNIRTEQLVVLLSAAAVLIFGWPRMLSAVSFPPMPILMLWLELLVVISLATIWPPSYLGGYEQLPIPNAFGAFILPLALMMLTWYWTLVMATREIIVTISRTIVVAMVGNSVLSVFQVMTNNVALVSVLPRFWSATFASNTSLKPVAVLAAENGRFTGIFNQPAEAGIAYGIALFGLIFLVQVRQGGWSRSFLLGGTCLCIGGILTISKIFLIGALPISALLIVRDRRRRARAVGWIGVLAGIYWLLSVNGALPVWRNGGKMLSGLVDPTGSLIRTFSAGRYGSGGSLGALGTNLLHLSPWVGFGAGGVNVAYDSMWIETLAVAGLFGIALIITTFILIFARWTSLGRTLPGPEWRFSGATLVLVLGGSFGLPSLTGNRVSTLFWLTSGVLIVGQARRSYRSRYMPLRASGMLSIPGVRVSAKDSSIERGGTAYAVGPGDMME